LASVLTPEAASHYSAKLLPNLYLWSENISALTILVQTAVTPLLESGVKVAGEKVIEKLSPYLRHGLFAPKSVVVAASENVLAEDQNQQAYTVLRNG
jgi:hypothetical protein